MKKILIVNDLIVGGGVEIILYQLATYLSKQNYAVTIATFKGDKKEFYTHFSKNIKYLLLKLPIKNNRTHSILWISEKIRYKLYDYFIKLRLEQKYDICIAIKEGYCMKYVDKLRAKQKYAWIHIDYRYAYWTQWVYGNNANELVSMKKFDKVICVSQAVADSVKKVIGDPGNLTVCYNPINFKEILYKAKMKSPYQKNKNGILFVSIGRITSQKNYSMLLQCCEKLTGKYKFELWIIGAGELKKEIEQKIKSLDLDCIKLLGAQENPYAILGQADCFISSAHWESYGLAIQEALILGIPVVATSCPAIEELWDERFGLLVENNLESLTEGMEVVLKQPDILKKYQENIHKYYQREKLWEPRMQKICNLWEK